MWHESYSGCNQQDRGPYWSGTTRKIAASLILLARERVDGLDDPWPDKYQTTLGLGLDDPRPCAKRVHARTTTLGIVSSDVDQLAAICYGSYEWWRVP
jgi:hypothetical protein